MIMNFVALDGVRRKSEQPLSENQSRRRRALYRELLLDEVRKLHYFQYCLLES